MDEFYQGQRLTAADLNGLAKQANEGMTSTNQIVNGKIVNSPTQLQYKQIYQAPRFLDTKYLMRNYKWPDEPESVNQHLYICLVDSEQLSFRSKGGYFSKKTDNARYAVAYFGKDYNAIRIVTKQDFDINTDLETRDLGNYLSGYVPNTNYNGFVETPIPPDSDVHCYQLVVVDENGASVGQLFLLFAKYDGSSEFTADQVKALKKVVDQSGEFQGGVGFLRIAGFTLILNQPNLSSSQLLDTYSNIIGSFNIGDVEAGPWEVLMRLKSFAINNPVFQIGTYQSKCVAFEDEKYQIHLLSELSGELSGSNWLSARNGQNYCVIDVPRLSAFHAYNSPDHPLSASPNVNAAFTVPILVFELYSMANISSDVGIKPVGLNYYDRNPLVPCWQVYPF